MSTEYRKGEIDELRKKLKKQAEILNAIDFLLELNEKSKLEYPVANFEDFIKKIEKEEREEIRIGVNAIKMKELEDVISAHYFPIINSEDFRDKITEFYNKTIEPTESMHKITEDMFPRGSVIPKDQVPSFPEQLKRVKPTPGQAGARIETV